MTPDAEEMSMPWIRQIIKGDKLLLRPAQWRPCNYRYHYKGCSKTDLIYMGMSYNSQVQKYLPNQKDWSRLGRDYVSNLPTCLLSAHACLDHGCHQLAD